ncbi:hypothetical protein NHX12_003169 [Muraenolepis orangiensis]|uniref:Proline-rich protein 5 n=1 Tax=Muraenolepis orangiensis TaxID=630683 RepID=A0A9Q0DYM0_9TELE|nr:hypothetical protein NHX12_003169 [Muraenolepis orangiensis]
MGSLRRPRARFMSSPALSDLARFQSASSVLQPSNTSVWNSVQTAVVWVFGGGALKDSDLYSLNESIRYLTPPTSSGTSHLIRYLPPHQVPHTSHLIRYLTPHQVPHTSHLIRYLTPHQVPHTSHLIRYLTPPTSSGTSHLIRYLPPHQVPHTSHLIRYLTPHQVPHTSHLIRYLTPHTSSGTSHLIRWLLKTELGSFITDYLQNQLLTKGLGRLLEKVQFYEGNNQLTILSEIWVCFFTEMLPTLQAIFYPVQMCLLAFRDLVLLKLSLEDTLGTATSVPPPLTQMLLVLQGVHDPSGSSPKYFQLERLVEMVISPYLGNILHLSNQQQLDGGSTTAPPRWRPRPAPQTEPRLSRPNSSSLPPLLEQEAEAYLEKSGGLRRHTVANAHSDLRLLSASAGCTRGAGLGCSPANRAAYSP